MTTAVNGNTNLRLVNPYYRQTAQATTSVVTIPQIVQTQPGNPGSSTNGAGVMMGLAGALTPKTSGRMKVTLSGDMYNSTNADGAFVRLRYGTGVAPTNGAANSGTTFGGQPQVVCNVGTERFPFSCQGVVTGLVIGTAYWIDASVGVITGGTAAIENLSLTIEEL